MVLKDCQEEHDFSTQKRQSNLELLTNILLNVKNGGNKTNLMKKINLNSCLIDIYLNYLSSKDLIEINNGVYKTTSKGLVVINRYNELCSLL